jgi:ribosomal protein S18 acetylase RimI-like enzyme
MITYEWSDWRAGLIWWIQSVYVLPDFRGRGVFSTLYKHIEALARQDAQVRAIRLYVCHHNKNGKKIYSQLGLKDSGYVVYEKEIV